MSIASELSALAANKAAIKAAIAAKNPSVAPTDALAQWPDAIASIPTGGGGGGYEGDHLTRILYHDGTASIHTGIVSLDKQGALTASDITQAIPSGSYVCALLIGYGVTSVDTANLNASYLKYVSIPTSVTSILDRAFTGAYIMAEEIVIPSSVASIGYAALQDIGGTTYTLVMDGRTKADVMAMNPVSWFGWTTATITIVCTDGNLTVTVECFAKGTKIQLADGTSKNVEDIGYGDMLKVWDFDSGRLSSAPICWLTVQGLKSNHYYELTFSDGTVLKTTGTNSNHKVYNVDTRRFEGVAGTSIGDRIYSLGGVVTVTDKKYVEETVEYYNLITKGAINCFAEGILASNRYGNMYPITSNMTYDKSGRTVRPYSVYEAVGIDRYWYDNLRLGEVNETVDETVRYISKLETMMRPLPQSADAQEV
ncbi:MAG: hypothetical protein IKF72_12380 [Kiritimatiellae bacterium]|nr:hypothetical protein [Kiritimatiellia bacterium]